MVSFDFEELLGDDTFFGKRIARGARNLACTIWNKYPDQWTKADPLTSPIKFFWNNVCEPENVNKQPIPQDFTGGQCPEIYRFRLQINVPVQGWIDFGLNFLGYGALGGARLVAIPPAEQAIQVLCFGNAASTGRFPQQQWIEFTRTNTEPTGVRLSNIVRQDGQPDNCGNPPPYFPPTIPPQPGVENTNITVNDGGDTDLTIPIGWFDIDFSVPITFKFEVGDIVLDVGGITINFDKDNEWNIYDNPPVADLPPEAKDQIDDIQDTVKEVDKTLEEEKKKFDKIEYDEQVFNTCSFLEFTDSSVDFVEIIVTKVPIKSKLIANENPNDTFFWAGYFCWTVGNARTTHVVVQKTDNFYKRPDWATGFAFFCVNDACARIIVYTKKIVPA